MGNKASDLRAAAATHNLKELTQIVSTRPDLVDVLNKHNRTALMKAAPDLMCMKILIEAGADVNLRDIDDMDALTYTLQRQGTVEAISLLISAGADITRCDASGDGLLHLAINYKCDTDVLALLIKEGVNINSTNRKKMSPIMRACEKGYIPSIKLLLDSGADPNIRNKTDDTTLNYAALRGKPASIVMLLEAGVNPNLKNNLGNTALMCATVKGNAEVIKCLLEGGAAKDIRNNSGKMAMDMTKVEKIKKLVSTDVVVVPSPISVAMWSNSTVTDWLEENNIKNGIDEIITCNGEQLLEKVYSENNCPLAPNVKARIIKLLDPIVKDKQTDSLLHNAILAKEEMEVIQAYLNAGANPNATDNKYMTPLLSACKKGYVPAIELLLKAGANPNFKNQMNDTALNYAAKKGKVTAVTLLLDAGADVNVQNSLGMTAVMCAAMKGNTSVIKELIRSGANINIVDRDGRTAYDLARNARTRTVLQEYTMDIDIPTPNPTSNPNSVQNSPSEKSFGNIDTTVNIAINKANTDGEFKVIHKNGHNTPPSFDKSYKKKDMDLRSFSANTANNVLD